MQFLARPYPDRVYIAARCDCLGHFHQLHTRNLGNKNFAAMHLFDTANHESDSLLARDPEACHAGIGDRYPAALALLLENRNHAATAAQHIAVARTTESSVLRAGIGVRLHEHFLGAEFSRAVQINGIYCLVGAQGQNAAHAAVDRGVDDVTATHNVGLDGFEGIVFAGRNLLERGGMNYDRDSGKCAFQTLGITNITDEIAQARMIKPRSPHVMLLEFVTAEDDELLRAVFAQHELDELPAKRTRPAGDQYNLFGPVHDVIPRSECIFLNELACGTRVAYGRNQISAPV